MNCGDGLMFKAWRHKLELLIIACLARVIISTFRKIVIRIVKY